MQHPYKSCQNNATDNLRTRSVSCFRCFSLSLPSTRFQSPWASAVGIAKPSGQVPLQLLLHLTSGCCPEAISHFPQAGPQRRRRTASLPCVTILPNCTGLGRRGQEGGSVAPRPTEHQRAGTVMRPSSGLSELPSILHSEWQKGLPVEPGGCKLDAKINPLGTR